MALGSHPKVVGAIAGLAAGGGEVVDAGSETPLPSGSVVSPTVSAEGELLGSVGLGPVSPFEFADGCVSPHGCSVSGVTAPLQPQSPSTTGTPQPHRADFAIRAVMASSTPRTPQYGHVPSRFVRLRLQFFAAGAM